VDHTFRVGVREGARDRHADRDGLLDRHRALGHALIEGLAAQQLHHEERPLIHGHAEVGDRHDVLVIELRRSVRLLGEPRAGFQARGQRRRQDLRSKLLEQGLMLDEVHHRHPADADRFEDSIVLAEHRSEERIRVLRKHE
jgi:hypothetical protein